MARSCEGHAGVMGDDVAGAVRAGPGSEDGWEQGHQGASLGDRMAKAVDFFSFLSCFPSFLHSYVFSYLCCCY